MPGTMIVGHTFVKCDLFDIVNASLFSPINFYFKGKYNFEKISFTF